jgi:phage tail-like protein
MPRGQEYLLLDSLAGWHAELLDGALISECSGGLELAPAPGAVRTLTDPMGTLGGLTVPTGVAIDCQERIWILDAGSSRLKRFDPCTGQFEDVPCAAPGKPDTPPGKSRATIAISRANDLYLIDPGRRQVLVYSVHGLTLRHVWGPYRVTVDNGIADATPVKPERTVGDCGMVSTFPQGSWEPTDIALDCENRAYVADYASGVVHIFDARGCPRGAYTDLEKPIRLALDRDGNLYVVIEGKDEVAVFDPDGKRLPPIPARGSVPGAFCPAAIAVDDAGNLHISDSLRSEVRILCRDEGGTYVQRYTYSVPAADLVFDSNGNAIVASPAQKLVAAVPLKALYLTSGKLLSEGLDSRIYKCVWHRILLRASIPAGCRVLVDTLTSEADKTLVELTTLPQERWARGQIDSQVGDHEWDCLIASPPGRYLWMRLTLESDGDATPVVQQAQIVFPRQSALQYLPAVYSEGTASHDFLDQFLSIFDRFWDGIGDQLTEIAKLFEPGATPPEFLPWLASWLGLTLDRHWSLHKRRQLLARAYRLFELRGTPEGLREHIRIYTGATPTILEHFQVRKWMFLDSARLGASSALFGSEIVNRVQLDEHAVVGRSQLIEENDPLRDPFHDAAHRFSVFVPVKETTGAEQQTLERIVEMAKPAYTQANVHVLRPRFRIGIQSFIGVDTVIGQYPKPASEGKASLGFDSVLGDPGDEGCPPTMRVGSRSRIGSARLN